MKQDQVSRKLCVRLSLRIKIGLLMTALVTVTVVLLTAFLLQEEAKSLKAEMAKRGLMIAQTLAASAKMAVITDDKPTLNLLLRDAMAQPDVAYFVVTDRTGRVLAHPDVTAIGTRHLLPGEPRGAGDRPLIETYVRPDGTRLMDVAIPLVFRRTPVGEMRLGFSEQAIDEAIGRAWRKTIGVSIVIALLGIGGALVLATGMVRPIRRLVEGTVAIAQGNFRVALAVRSHDEIGLLIDSFNRMARSLREKEMIKQAFGRYVAREVVEQLLKDPENLALSGEMRDVTVVFCDIRGFTTLAERMKPEEVVQLVNDFYNLMFDATVQHEGTLDKFVGDAVMAIFGAPIPRPDHSIRAIRAALAMRAAAEALSLRRIADGKEPVGVGIGVSTGISVAGTVGTPDRMQYTVIGDSVNLAARLESHAKPMQILVNDRTYRNVEGLVHARPLGLLKLKGKDEDVDVYEVLSLR